MKKPNVMHPDLAFPDERPKPRDSDLPDALGRAFLPLNAVLTGLRASHPDVVPEWRFSPYSGWHQIYCRKARRILYFIPRRDDYRVMLILGDKAIAALRAGPHAKRMPALLKTAKRYPEGTAFSFDRHTLDVDLVAAFLEAKIAH
jgi:Protein of unknown function (DUF3788)